MTSDLLAILITFASLVIICVQWADAIERTAVLRFAALNPITELPGARIVADVPTAFRNRRKIQP